MLECSLSENTRNQVKYGFLETISYYAVHVLSNISRINRTIYAYSGYFMVVIAASSLALRALVPANILLGTSYDDWLGVQLAQNLQNGEWLGVWDIRTLMKGAGYSIFIAPLGTFGVSPTIAVHALYLYGCWLVISALENVSTARDKSKLFKLIGFTFAAFNPLVYSSDFSRIHRMSLFGALLIIGIGHAIYLISAYRTSRKLKFYTHLIGLGFILGFCRVTRSESTITIIVIVSIVILQFILNRASFLRSIFPLRKFGEITGIVTILIFCTALPSLIVGQMNLTNYGARVTDNYLGGSFEEAFGALTAIQPRNEERMYVPVSKNQLDLAYVASPTFKTLKDYMDSADSWEKQTSCQQGVACDSSSSWMTYEIRDAAQTSHNFTNEKDFQGFFDKIAREIHDACAKKTVSCGTKGIATGVAPVNHWNLKQVASLSIESVHRLLNFDYPINKQPQTNELVESIYPEWASTVVMPDRNALLLGTPNQISTLLEVIEDIYAVLSWLILFVVLLNFRKLIKSHLNSRTNNPQSRGLVFAMLVILLVVNVLTSVIANSSFGLGVITIYLIPGALCQMVALLSLIQIIILEFTPKEELRKKETK
jgi:hypothetical protein